MQNQSIIIRCLWVLVFALPGLPFSGYADSTDYSLGIGLLSTRETVSSAQKGGTRVLQVLSGAGGITWFQGSKENGGITFSFNPGFVAADAQLSDPGSESTPTLAGMYSLGLGYQFFQPLGKGLYWRFGPTLSFMYLLSVLDDYTTQLQVYYGAVPWGVGAMSQIDWHPFDTGNGSVDGLFLFLSGAISLDFPDFPRGRASAMTGFGMTLE